MCNGSAFHFCTKRAGVFHDLLLYSLIANELVTAGNPADSGVSCVDLFRSIIRKVHQCFICRKRPHSHSRDLTHRIQATQNMAIKIVVHRIPADHKIADIQFRTKGSCHTSVDNVGNRIDVTKSLDAQSGIDLAHTTHNHNHRELLQGSFKEAHTRIFPGLQVLHILL